MRLIVRFERLEEIKYISQLDMLRTIHRALRRADIPVAYSEGFNPQPKVSFGFALSVGLVSYGEYMDIQLKTDIDAELFKEKMNNVLPRGMRITDAAAAGDLLGLVFFHLHGKMLGVGGFPHALDDDAGEFFNLAD